MVRPPTYLQRLGIIHDVNLQRLGIIHDVNLQRLGGIYDGNGKSMWTPERNAIGHTHARAAYRAKALEPMASSSAKSCRNRLDACLSASVSVSVMVYTCGLPPDCMTGT